MPLLLEEHPSARKGGQEGFQQQYPNIRLALDTASYHAYIKRNGADWNLRPAGANPAPPRER